MPLVKTAEFSVPVVFFDIRVVVTLIGFWQAIPGFDTKDQVVFLENEIGVQPIPAS